jgi:hypothetical protein
MKPSALRIERMLEKIEAKLVPPERKWLQVFIHEGVDDDEAAVKEKKEKALAEHVAHHPEDVGRTVEDFNWILHEFVRPRFRVEFDPASGREIVKWPREAGDPPLPR